MRDRGQLPPRNILSIFAHGRDWKSLNRAIKYSTDGKWHSCRLANLALFANCCATVRLRFDATIIGTRVIPDSENRLPISAHADALATGPAVLQRSVITLWPARIYRNCTYRCPLATIISPFSAAIVKTKLKEHRLRRVCNTLLRPLFLSLSLSVSFSYRARWQTFVRWCSYRKSPVCLAPRKRARGIKGWINCSTVIAQRDNRFNSLYRVDWFRTTGEENGERMENEFVSFRKPSLCWRRNFMDFFFFFSKEKIDEEQKQRKQIILYIIFRKIVLEFLVEI